MTTLRESLNDVTDASADHDFEKALFQALIQGTRHSNALPSNEEGYDYFKTTPEFQDKMGACQQRIQNLISKLVQSIGNGGAGTDDPDEYENISSLVDLLLEDVDNNLDQDQGKNENSMLTVAKNEMIRQVTDGLHNITESTNIEPPQKHFKRKVDNSRTPFIPFITTKPNSIDDLALPLRPIINEPSACDGMEVDISLNHHIENNLGIDIDQHTQGRCLHPYKTEIINCSNNNVIPEWISMDGSKTHAHYRTLENTKYVYVDTLESLQALCLDLKNYNYIAVDLENHSYRSFQGFLCLMQISTADTDYIIDVIKLREYMHEYLIDCFTNPNILKILHGADHDIVWLQRDFSLYIVCMFDTGQAARVLGYPSASFSFALRKHCNVNANKAFQLADWRLRPLTSDMIKYAREDTHYLIYIFNMMRKELIQASSDYTYLNLTWRKSCNITLFTYEKDIFTNQSYTRLIKRLNLNFTSMQERVFESLYEWRDSMARNLDESTEYVLSNTLLVKLSLNVPKNVDELRIIIGNPVPPIVLMHLNDLMEVIQSSTNSKNTIGSLNSSFTAPSSKISSMKYVEVPTNQQNVVQLNVNSLQSSFVPITSSSTVAFSANASGEEKKSFKLNQHDISLRATPSPVLTTDQLYAHAGWQDLQDATKRLANSSKTNLSSSMAEQQCDSSVNKSHFIVPVQDTVSAANQSLVNQTKKEISMQQERLAASTPSTADIPKSMEEIYEISNLNRKRNKEKKIQKDKKQDKANVSQAKTVSDSTAGNRVPLIQMSSNATSSSAEAAKKENKKTSDTSKGDNVVSFMKDIGWVDPAVDSISSHLIIEGAPEQPRHLAGATVVVEDDDDSTDLNAPPPNQQVRMPYQHKQQRGNMKGGNNRRSNNHPQMNNVASFDYSQQNILMSSGVTPQHQQQQRQSSYGGRGGGGGRGKKSQRGGGSSRGNSHRPYFPRK